MSFILKRLAPILTAVAVWSAGQAITAEDAPAARNAGAVVLLAQAAPAPAQAQPKPPPVKRKPNRRMPGVEHISWFMALMMVAFLGPVFIFIHLAKKGRKLFLRKLPGVDAIDEAIGRAVEMGRPMMFSTGLLSSIGPVLFACLGILSHVARKAATYTMRVVVPQVAPDVMAITQDVVHQAYRSVGREDAYDPESVRYLSPNQFAFASGYMGIAHREKTAACFLFGEFAAESLILAEAGQQVGAIQVAGTISNPQIPFFVTTCDYTIIGEEMYAVSAYLSREPVLLGSLRGQDVAKLAIFMVVLIGVILATIYQVGGYNVDFATWLIARPSPEL